MNDEDCTAIASNANIQLLCKIDIFYDNRFQFKTEHDNDDSNADFLYDKNYKAAQNFRKHFDNVIKHTFMK